MNKRALYAVLSFILWSVPQAATAQNPVPTSQPSVLVVFREEVKYGHNTEHESVEAGWPAAFAKAKSPNTYIAITSMTGTNEAWFLSPYANWKALGDEMKMQGSDATLSAELARLSKADAEHVNNGRTLHLLGRADLSAGTFPSIAKARFYEVTILRVRPGHEREFEGLAKVIQTAYNKAAPDVSYRIYQVVAGAPGPTYMIFSSVPTLGDLDKMQATDAAMMTALSQQDMSALQKFSAEGLINAETQRFAVNGRMSYVDDATANQDLSFWRPGIKASK
ncbi:MAG TPA: hypothetical protein VF021_07105 [Longimicrobiales bacterium]